MRIEILGFKTRLVESIFSLISSLLLLLLLHYLIGKASMYLYFLIIPKPILLWKSTIKAENEKSMP